MRKIKIIEHISLDGIIQAPGGPGEDDENFAYGGWTAPYGSKDGAEAVARMQGEKFDLLLGRRTYNIFAGYWPNAGSSAIADGLNAATKYVVTHKPEGLEWGPLGELGPDVMEGIRKLKLTNGPDLVVWGSSTITSVLMEHELVDEVILFIYPVLLGRGKRFFSAGVEPRELALMNTNTIPSGVMINIYRYIGSLRL